MEDLLELAVDLGLRQGADTATARYDDLKTILLTSKNGELTNKGTTVRRGFNFTCYVGGQKGGAYTPETIRESIKQTVKTAIRVARAKQTYGLKPIVLDALSEDLAGNLGTLAVKKHPNDTDIEAKLAYVERIETATRDSAGEIQSVEVKYAEYSGTKQVLASGGRLITWNPLVIDLYATVTAKIPGGGLIFDSDRVAGSAGLELFDSEKDGIEAKGTRLGKSVTEIVTADHVNAGMHRVLLDPSLAGLLAHESLGHMSEADFVLTGWSVLKDKKGEAIGSPAVTVIDAGTVSEGGYPLFLPYDDEGIPAGSTTIVEKGILKNFLSDRENAALLGEKPTGNGRAVAYYHTPIPRMRNTYFTDGEVKTEEEMLELLGNGVYLQKTRGGHGGANFSFTTGKGYLVKNGEIKSVLHSTTMSGELLKFLHSIEHAGKNVVLESGYFGGCGKIQSPLQVGMGGPLLLSSAMRLGGKSS